MREVQYSGIGMAFRRELAPIRDRIGRHRNSALHDGDSSRVASLRDRKIRRKKKTKVHLNEYLEKIYKNADTVIVIG